MKSPSAALLLLLALLFALAPSAPGKAEWDLENRVGDFSELSNRNAWEFAAPSLETQWVEWGWLYDPASGVCYGPNVYAYVGNNPWTSFDPYGLDAEQAGKVRGVEKVFNFFASGFGLADTGYGQAMLEITTRINPLIGQYERVRRDTRQTLNITADHLENGSDSYLGSATRARLRTVHQNDIPAYSAIRRGVTGPDLEVRGREIDLGWFDRSFLITQGTVEAGLLLAPAAANRGSARSRSQTGTPLEPAPATPRFTAVIGEGTSSSGGVFRAGALVDGKVHVGKGGHFDGAAAAGARNVDPRTAKGISVFEKGDNVFWANDSISLPKALTSSEAATVQKALEAAFPNKAVKQLTDISEAVK